MKLKASGIEFDVIEEKAEQVTIRLKARPYTQNSLKPEELEAASDWKRTVQEAPPEAETLPDWYGYVLGIIA